MLEIEKNYRIGSRFYQPLFAEITETFIQYINTLTSDEIEQFNDNLRSYDWGVQSIVEIEDSIDLLCIFQVFYYFNGRAPLTNSLLPVPDGETPEGFKKISLKTLYEMLKDTKSHNLFPFNFYHPLIYIYIFFGGDIGLSKDTIT